MIYKRHFYKYTTDVTSVVGIVYLPRHLSTPPGFSRLVVLD
jgi:hypothetical protein